eukprot:2012-Pelagococcus_subviridis.AAC.1
MEGPFPSFSDTIARFHRKSLAVEKVLHCSRQVACTRTFATQLAISTSPRLRALVRLTWVS